MKRRFATLALNAAFAASVSAAASTFEGDALYSEKGCAACHGDDGETPINSGYPKFAGQNRDYLIRQIQDIRSGARDKGLIVQMKPVAQGLTDAEIDSIADYLSRL
ncbi:MAG: c-type cytochrome [Gammaproteobacteria bacterium]|nr:c-type cytochrome [Gammaproteobacteria bacterium]